MRGDVYPLRSDRRAKGREQKGARFAVALQADYLPLETMIVAPTTTSPVGAAFWPTVTINGRTSYVLVEQMTAVDLSRLGTPVDRLLLSDLELVDERIRDVLGL